MRWLLAVALLFFFVAGCTVPAAQKPPTSTSTPPAALDPLMVPTFSPIVQVGTTANSAEPSIAVGSRGEIYIANPVFHLWRSDDLGRTFTALGKDACDEPQAMSLPICPPIYQTKNPGLVGPNDADLVVTPNGTVLWAGLEGGGYAVPFQVSTDHGETFSKPVELGTKNSADRQWLDQRPDGRVLLVWRDAPGAADASVLARVSTDEGASWSAPTKVARDAFAEGKPAHTPNGTWLMPHYLSGSILVASSLDGITWNDVVAYRDVAAITPTRNGGPYAGNPVIAADANGTVYLAWSKGGLGQQTGLKEADIPQVYLSVSHDDGATWTPARVISVPGKSAVMPAIVAGAPGRIAVAWYENQLGAPNEAAPDEWNVRLAESINAEADTPTFQSALASPTPTHIGGICTDGGGCLIGARDRSAGDFFSITLTPDGHPIMVFGGDTATGSRASVAILVAIAGGTHLIAPR